MSSDDLFYFRTRAAEERQRASTATSPATRAFHLEFAARYEQLAGQLRAVEQTQSSRNAIHRSLALLRATATAAASRYL